MVRTSATRSRVSIRSTPPVWILMRLVAVPPTSDEVGRLRADRSAEQLVGGGAHRRDRLGLRRVGRDEARRQPVGPDPQPGGTSAADGADRAELGAAAADVDDEGLVLDRETRGDADHRQEGLFFVREHVERDAGTSLHVHDDARAIRGPSERLGPEQRDRRCSQVASCGRVAAEDVGKLGSSTGAEVGSIVDGCPQPQERRFVDQRAKPMVGDGGDHEVHRIGPEVDGGPDGWSRPGVRRHAALRRSRALALPSIDLTARLLRRVARTYHPSRSPTGSIREHDVNAASTSG